MEIEERYIKTIRIRIYPPLLEKVRNEANRLNTDISTYVRCCIRTGIYLDDVNLFVRSKRRM
jgi:hypothetical protein